MIKVALHLLHPLGENAVNAVGIGEIESPIGKFPPDDISFFVAMVKETLLENFFMKPRAVEAHRHGTLDIGEQCFVARRGINARRDKIPDRE